MLEVEWVMNKKMQWTMLGRSESGSESGRWCDRKMNKIKKVVHLVAISPDL